MLFKDLHFHRHVGLEKKFKVPEDHVIIDKEAFDIINNLIQEEKKVAEVKEKEEKEFSFQEPILSLYPNKFKLIKDLKEVSGPGLYYINDQTPEWFDHYLRRWISDFLKSKPFIAAGYQHASINLVDFFERYQIDRINLGKINSKHGIFGRKRDYYLENDFNPIHIDENTGFPRISLYGNHINSLKFEGKLITVEFAAVLMSSFKVLFEEGEQRFLNYLYFLKTRRIICYGDQHPVHKNLVYINPSCISFYYQVDLDNKEAIKKDFDTLKRYLIKEEEEE